MTEGGSKLARGLQSNGQDAGSSGRTNEQEVTMIKNALTTLSTLVLTVAVSGTLVVSAVGPATAHGTVASPARIVA